MQDQLFDHSAGAERRAIIADLQQAGLVPVKRVGTPLDEERLSVQQPSPVVRQSEYEGQVLGIVTEAPGTPFEPFLAHGLVSQHSRRLDVDDARQMLRPPEDRSFAEFHRQRRALRATLAVALLPPSQNEDLWERERENELIDFARRELKIRALAQQIVRKINEERSRDRSSRDDQIRALHHSDPHLSKAQLAHRFNVSARHVRMVLARP